MRLLICAGGTGGGVNPALAVLGELAGAADPGVRALQPVEVLWVGGVGGIEEDLVKRAGVPFEAISAAGVHGVGPRALPGNLWQLSRGYRQSQAILRRFQPDVLFFTGGYLAVPMALAGRDRPILLYVPDIEPGLALKTLARFADRIALTVSDSAAYFPRHPGLEVTGYPTRPELRPIPRSQAAQALALSPELPTLLVSGGSRGARSINRALIAALPALLPEMQIVHLSGQLDWPEVEAARDALPPELAGRYRTYPYLHGEMAAALSLADLVLSRAGASVLGEYPLFGLPAVLVPYPYAWRYQRTNAEYLVQRGAALMALDEELSAQFVPLVQSLMRDPARRESMRRAMLALARPEAAKNIAELLRRTAVPNGQERT